MNRRTHKSKHVYLIDESDKRTFADINEFHAKTSLENVTTIYLTATAYAGSEQSLEKAVLDAMDMNVYSNSGNKDDFEPVIHENIELGSLEKYRTFIQNESLKCAVLVYSSGENYAQLSTEENIEVVND